LYTIFVCEFVVLVVLVGPVVKLGIAIWMVDVVSAFSSEILRQNRQILTLLL